MADHVIVGKTGVVTARIATGGIGEVIIPVRGGREAYAARIFEEDLIEVGARVVVVDQLSARTLLVSRM